MSGEKDPFPLASPQFSKCKFKYYKEMGMEAFG